MLAENRMPTIRFVVFGKGMNYDPWLKFVLFSYFHFDNLLMKYLNGVFGREKSEQFVCVCTLGNDALGGFNHYHNYFEVFICKLWLIIHTDYNTQLYTFCLITDKKQRIVFHFSIVLNGLSSTSSRLITVQFQSP